MGHKPQSKTIIDIPTVPDSPTYPLIHPLNTEPASPPKFAELIIRVTFSRFSSSVPFVAVETKNGCTDIMYEFISPMKLHNANSSHTPTSLIYYTGSYVDSFAGSYAYYTVGAASIRNQHGTEPMIVTIKSTKTVFGGLIIIRRK